MTGSSSCCKSLHNPVLHFWELDSRLFSHEKNTILSRRGNAGPALPEIQVLQLQTSCPTSGFRRHICSLQGTRTLRPRLWPNLCPSNQELMQLKISVAIVDLFLFYSRAESRQLQQPDLGPRHQYLVNNLHIKYINQPFRCCIRKSKVKLRDRQWLLLKYANAT